MLEISSVHVGNEVMKVMREKRMSVLQVANEIGIDSSGLSKLLRKNDCSVERLAELSRVMDFNFFELFTKQKTTEAALAEMKQQVTDREKIIADKDQRIAEKERRIAELEKENALLREVMEVLKKR